MATIPSSVCSACRALARNGRSGRSSSPRVSRAVAAALAHSTLYVRTNDTNYVGNPSFLMLSINELIDKFVKII